MTDAGPVLRLDGLTKKFGARTAVDNLSFDVAEGDIFGFLGPNGAGKSTTMYMVLGLVHPTSGRAEIFGRPHTDVLAVRSRLGALVETPAFYEYLSGRKNLEVLARGQQSIGRAAIDEALDRVGLLARAGSRVREYSHGMKQRLGLAQALLNRPRLLMLDEPTNGLDPEGSQQMWNVLHELVRTERTTVFVSSHLLHEVEENCNRIAVINQGILVACDEVRRLLFFSKEDCLFVFESAETAERAHAFLAARDGVELLAPEDTGSSSGVMRAPAAPGTEECTVRVRLLHGLSSECVMALSGAGLAPRAVVPLRKTLKQFFFELTRRQPQPL